jgi:hypothetical protein
MRRSARLGAATVLTGGGTGTGAGGGAFSCRLVVGILGISCGKRKRMYKIHGKPYNEKTVQYRTENNFTSNSRYGPASYRTCREQYL